jgi:hypothetical protein
LLSTQSVVDEVSKWDSEHLKMIRLPKT